MDDNEAIKKVAEMMKGAKICSLTTVNSNGQLTSRPMAVQQIEFDGDAWFFAQRSSTKLNEIAANPQVNIMFNSGDDWVSLSGTARQVDDIEKAGELWNPFLKAWFPEGLSDPELTLIKVHAESAEYWDSDNKLTSLFGMVKAAVTGKPTEGGENETVQL